MVQIDANAALAMINELERLIEDDAENHGASPNLVESEPVVISHLVSAALTTLVAWGWIAIPIPAINVIATIIGFLVVAGIAVAARHKVTPSAKWEDSVKELVAGAVEAEVAKVTSELTKITSK